MPLADQSGRPGFNGRGNNLVPIAFSAHLAREILMSIEGNTENLISSDKHSGKAVYGAEDKKIGSIESVMVDKSSGEAVLSIGGILAMGPTTTRCLGGYSDTTLNSMAIAATSVGTG
jgi:hypothetical protein